MVAERFRCRNWLKRNSNAAMNKYLRSIKNRASEKYSNEYTRIYIKHSTLVSIGTHQPHRGPRFVQSAQCVYKIH